MEGQAKNNISLPHFLKAWAISKNPIRFSPFDIRIIIRIATFLIIWKLLSLDYSAFPILMGGPEFFPLLRPLNRLAHIWQPLLFDQVWKIHALQLGGAIVLFVGAWRMSRPLLAVGLAAPLLLEWNAILYRGQMFDLDIPCALLVLALLGPWRAATTGGRDITTPATWTGWMLTVYMAGTYLLSGLSKLQFDVYWWQHVRLDLLYPVMELWHGQTFPAWLHPIAFRAHEMLARWPDMALMMAGVVLLMELGWWLVLVNRLARLTIPPAMVLFHLGFFLGAGTLFLSMAIMGISLVIPWRRLSHARSTPDQRFPPPTKPIHTAWLPVMIVVTMLALWVPTVTNNTFPFSAFNVFAWSYAGAAQPTTVYRLAYRVPGSRDYALLPNTYGGFMDYRLVGYASVFIDRIANTPPEDRRPFADRVEQFVRAIRPRESNRWLLGPLAYPDHLVSEAQEIPIDQLQELYMLKGQYTYQDGELHSTWTMLGQVGRGLRDEPKRVIVREIQP